MTLLFEIVRKEKKMHFYFKLRRLILQLCVVNCQRPILSHDKPWKLSCAHFYCHRFHLKSFLSLPSGDKTNYCTGSAVWIQCPHEKLLDIEGLPFPHGWAASRLAHIFCSSLFYFLTFFTFLFIAPSQMWLQGSSLSISLPAVLPSDDFFALLSIFSIFSSHLSNLHNFFTPPDIKLHSFFCSI